MRPNTSTIAALLAMLSIAPVARPQCEPVWSGVGRHDGWPALAQAIYDVDGGGPLAPELVIGPALGDILSVARWDGWMAAPVGDEPPQGTVRHLQVVPESGGALAPGLYAGGTFAVAGGAPANNVARWQFPEWDDVGGGVTRPGMLIPYVFATQVFDEDGAGPLAPALFVGGIFDSAGGVPVESLARWDGARWSEVGGELRTPTWPSTQAVVSAMTIFDDGRGPALYVAGSFTSADGTDAWNIARWDGAAWESVGPGLNTTVESLCVFDEDGAGPKRPALFAGGQFSAPRGGKHGDLYRIGRWDGAEWTEVGGWLSAGSVRAMAVWDVDGPGPAPDSLYIGGLFNILPDLTPVSKIARWDGERWHDVGGGVTGFGAGTSVSALASFDEDGPGPNPGGLYVGGLFYRAGGVETKHIARWGCPLPPAPPCYADCDESGALDLLDFLCFQNAFAAAAPSADCDQSGALDFFDFLCFQNVFAAGCP